MKSIKVRIALEIGPEGNWQAAGGDLVTDDWEEAMDGLEPIEGHHVARHWIEAEVPVPVEDAAVVAGKAMEAAPAQLEDTQTYLTKASA